MVYIINKGFINTQDEHGVVPYVVDKNITITTENDFASLTVRAGGIILDANVKIENIELNFANKYRNCIFLNGNIFEAINVTRGSGSRDVHLVCGGVYDTDTKKLVSPTPGNAARLIVTENSEFGNIYAGSLNGDFDGNVDITITAGEAMNLAGNIYASGADETRITTDDWFDINEEPKPPAANNNYEVSGRVNLSMNGIRARYIDGAAAKGGTAVTLSTEYPYDSLSLDNISKLTIAAGTVEPQGLTARQNGISVNIPSGGRLNLKNVSNPTVSNFNGGGTIVIANDDMLTVTGNVTGTTAFETAGGFGGSSGIAEAGHTYIKAPKSQKDSFTFKPFSGQAGMTLTKDEAGFWTTPAPSAEPTLAESFDAAEKFTVTALNTVNENYGAEIPVNWTATVENAWLSEIPLNYEVEYGGEKYAADVVYDEETSTYGAVVLELHMEIVAYEPDVLTVAMATSVTDIQPMKAGIYRITASTVSKAWETLTSVFTVAVVDEDASEGSGALAVITDGASNAVTSLSAGNFTAKAVIPKNTENATVILAKYSGNELKELKLSSAVSKTDADFTVKETETISVLESEVQSVKLKVFVFESMQTIKPLCKQEEI